MLCAWEGSLSIDGLVAESNRDGATCFQYAWSKDTAVDVLHGGQHVCFAIKVDKSVALVDERNVGLSICKGWRSSIPNLKGISNYGLFTVLTG